MTPWHTFTPPERLVFHKTFEEWLSSASESEMAQYDALQDAYPSPVVRSTLTFIRECLEDPLRRPQVPADLVRRLQAVNWQPAVANARGL
jgi:hypothetical protein